MTITSYIKMTVECFIQNGLAESPYDINNGLCEDFAIILETAGFGVSLWQDELEDRTPLSFGEHKKIIEDCGHHCFILNGKQFYDAECPQGVTHPKDLPLFKKVIGRHVLNKS